LYSIINIQIRIIQITMIQQGRMIYNPEKGIYEPEEAPGKYLTATMVFNHTTNIWEPRTDDPTNPSNTNYSINATHNMVYDNWSGEWKSK